MQVVQSVEDIVIMMVILKTASDSNYRKGQAMYNGHVYPTKPYELEAVAAAKKLAAKIGRVPYYEWFETVVVERGNYKLLYEKATAELERLANQDECTCNGIVETSCPVCQSFTAELYPLSEQY